MRALRLLVELNRARRAGTDAVAHALAVELAHRDRLRGYIATDTRRQRCRRRERQTEKRGAA